MDLATLSTLAEQLAPLVLQKIKGKGKKEVSELTTVSDYENVKSLPAWYWNKQTGEKKAVNISMAEFQQHVQEEAKQNLTDIKQEAEEVNAAAQESAASAAASAESAKASEDAALAQKNETVGYLNTVKANEDERISTENARKEAETLRVQAEAARAQAVIFDVSSHNDGAVFDSLSALLSNSNLDTLIPVSVRHGGMTIRFIQGSEQSSDNKYVQYRLMSTDWSNVAGDWQGVDSEPTAGSDNLVKSGGVQATAISKNLSKNVIQSTFKGFYDKLTEGVINENYEETTDSSTQWTKGYVRNTGVIVTDTDNYQYSEPIQVSYGDKITLSTGGQFRFIAAYSSGLIQPSDGIDSSVAGATTEYVVPMYIDKVIVTSLVCDSTIKIAKSSISLSSQEKDDIEMLEGKMDDVEEVLDTTKRTVYGVNRINLSDTDYLTGYSINSSAAIYARED